MRPLGFFVWLVALFLFPLVEVQAHGGGQPQVVGGRVGPYRVNIWTSPEPPRAQAPFHVTVAVYQPGERMDTPVTHARVTVTLTPEQGPPLTVEAVPGDTYPYYYEADVELPREGPWQVAVHVRLPESQEEAVFTFAVEAKSSSRIPVLWVATGLLVVTALFWWWLGGRRDT